MVFQTAQNSYYMHCSSPMKSIINKQTNMNLYIRKVTVFIRFRFCLVAIALAAVQTSRFTDDEPHIRSEAFLTIGLVDHKARPNYITKKCQICIRLCPYVLH